MSENRPNSGIEVAVVAWAERHGFSGSCVTSAPLTRTLEHRSLKVETVSRMCKAQLQAALRFVSHRVRSEDEVRAIRATLAHAASLPSARISQKLTSLKHAYADQAIRRNGLAKKRDDLALREAFVRRGIESKEASLKNASDRLLQQESHLNAFSRIVQDKRRKLALLEANEREAADLVAILNQYSLLVTSLLDLKSSGTVATLTEIQDLCSRIEVHYFHPTTKTKSESDTDIIMAVQSLTVEGSCSELLHNLTHLARFSSESLSECPLRVATASSFDTDAVNAQLDKAMRAHVSRYAQVKKLRAETEKFLLHMEQALHAIEDETDDPDVARALLLHLHAAGDLEGYRAVDTALNAYVVELENNVRRLKTEAFALKDYKERIEALEKELTRKHSLIASVMEANILSRSNITAVKNRNKQVAVTRLAVNAPTLDALVSKLYGFVSRELHALAGVRVSRPEWRNILYDEVLENDRACSSAAVDELKVTLGMPIFLAVDQIPVHIRELQDELARVKHMEGALNLDVSSVWSQIETAVSHMVTSASSTDWSSFDFALCMNAFLRVMRDESIQYDQITSALMESVRHIVLQEAPQAINVSRSITKLRNAMSLHIQERTADQLLK